MSDKKRYYTESYLLRDLAFNQLNLPKNIIKKRFEECPSWTIMQKTDEELKEFYLEILEDNIDFERAFSELGDVAACLVGWYAYLVKLREKSDDA